jgi:hypothetical protein
LDSSWEATKRNKKTKAIIVPHLVDEDNSRTSSNDHEGLCVENENLQELNVDNE